MERAISLNRERLRVAEESHTVISLRTSARSQFDGGGYIAGKGTKF